MSLKMPSLWTFFSNCQSKFPYYRIIRRGTLIASRSLTSGKLPGDDQVLHLNTDATEVDSGSIPVTNTSSEDVHIEKGEHDVQYYSANNGHHRSKDHKKEGQRNSTDGDKRKIVQNVLNSGSRSYKRSDKTSKIYNVGSSTDYNIGDQIKAPSPDPLQRFSDFNRRIHESSRAERANDRGTGEPEKYGSSPAYTTELHDYYFSLAKQRLFRGKLGIHKQQNNEKVVVDADPLGPDTFHLLEKLNIGLPKTKFDQNSPGKCLVATIHFSGHMYDHIDAVAYFARFCALSVNIVCPPVISMPTEIKRWKIHRSPFAKVKNKESFERRLYTRAVQFYDADAVPLSHIISYIKLRLPRAVNMKVVTYDYTSIRDTEVMYTQIKRLHPILKQCIKTLKEPFELEVESIAKNYINEWNRESSKDSEKDGSDEVAAGCAPKSIQDGSDGVAAGCAPKSIQDDSDGVAAGCAPKSIQDASS